jgi:iron complex transport system substrate-binding protein
MAMDRRRVIIGSGAAMAAIAGGLLSVPARAQDATPAATPADGEWTFTDDKGVTITLPQRPTRLAIDVNAAAPLWDFGIRPAALFGWNVLADGSLGDAGGNIDPTGIPLVGNVNEQIIVEDLVGIEPDLLITLTFTPDDPDEYWSFQPDVLEQIRAGGYPVLAMSGTGNVGETVVRFAELATALGADLSAPDQVAAKDAYDAKVEEFQASIAAKPDLTYMFGYLAAAELYIASEQDFGDLTFFGTLGLDILDAGVEAGEYWLQISPEELGSYPTDVVMNSTREGNYTPEQLQADPVFSLHPAVAAGQVYGWNQDVIMSYQGLTIALDDVLAANEAANKVT